MNNQHTPKHTAFQLKQTNLTMIQPPSQIESTDSNTPKSQIPQTPLKLPSLSTNALTHYPKPLKTNTLQLKIKDQPNQSTL